MVSVGHRDAIISIKTVWQEVNDRWLGGGPELVDANGERFEINQVLFCR